MPQAQNTRWIMIYPDPSLDDNEFPAWMCSAALATDGSIFVAAAPAAEESVILRLLDLEQVELYRFSDNHLYVASKWMSKLFPEMREVLARIEDAIRWRFLLCDAQCVTETVQ